MSNMVRVGAVVLAAGRSQRMGRPKMILPWGNTTVLGQVVFVLQSQAVDPIVVVTGGSDAEISKALTNFTVLTVLNENFAKTEMLTSLQIGLSKVAEDVGAVLVCLGDQPQIEVTVVHALVDAFRRTNASIIIPSYQMRRGHPWLVGRQLWAEIENLASDSNLRVFLDRHQAEIMYVAVDTDTVLLDLDTPEDYARESGRLGKKN